MEGYRAIYGATMRAEACCLIEGHCSVQANPDMVAVETSVWATIDLGPRNGARV